MNHSPHSIGLLFLLLLALVLSGTSATQSSHAHEPATAVELPKMREAVLAWRDSLGPELARKATFAFDDKRRTDWQFVPMERDGVNWSEMNLRQRRAAHALLRTALSSQGFFKAITIMSLENELRRMEADRPGVENIRDPEKYWFAIFGDPASDKPWGWRIEGHHLSLNFSSVIGQVVSVTPAFFGSNPAELRDGPRAGLRVLGAEEDLGRQLITSCSPEQQQTAIIAVDAPGDVIAMPGLEIKFAEPDGLAADQMTPEQQAILRRLVDELVGNFNPELKNQAWHEIEDAGFEKLHFAWAGSLERGKPHYFRVHGPTLAIEYDNTQNDANHAHLVWHSPGNNFGADFLRRHYEESPHHQR
jgi:hypothetical protein